jgi:hypothetical protein
MTLAPSKSATTVREEIALAETAYAIGIQTGDFAGKAPHELRDYIEVRENELLGL